MWESNQGLAFCLALWRNFASLQPAAFKISPDRGLALLIPPDRDANLSLHFKS